MTTIITTSMGRLEHLKQSVPTWLEHTDFDILVVDYGCPDGTARWVLELAAQANARHRVRLLIVKPMTPHVFSKARALNTALRSVPPSEKLVLLDADTLVLDRVFGEVATAINPGRFLVADPSSATRDLTGVLVVRAAELLATGGFDETMVGWGAEDLDVRIRLLLSGIEPEWFPPGMLEAIQHGDELRTRHYPIKDKAESNKINTARIFQKICSSLDEVSAMVAHPTIRRLLGAGLHRDPDAGQ